MSVAPSSLRRAQVMLPVATGSLVPSQPDFVNVKTVFAVMVGFPGDEEVRGMQ